MMKCRFLVLFVWVLGNIVQLNAQPSPRIQFKETTINFGAFTDKDPIKKGVFHFTNEGDKTLIITQVKPSCGCTVATFSKYPIHPGKSGTVTVVYDGTNRYGHFRKSIVVHSNDPDQPTILYISGEMKLSASSK